jgi:nucleoside diphosphate kinase
MEWARLTRMPRKAETYRRECYFREALVDAQELLGAATADVLHSGAFLMIKPDGLRAGKLAAVHSFVLEHGFTVVSVEELTFTGHMWRELWRHQLTSATLDRLAIKDALYTGQSALALLLRSEDRNGLPGTVRLSTLKGSANLATQASGTLRSRLRQPNRVFSLVHFADEPADIVRELGVLFPPDVRRRMLSALDSGDLADADRTRLDQALARAAAGGDGLTIAASVKRVGASLDAVLAVRPAEAQRVAEVRQVLEKASGGSIINWRRFVRDVKALGCRIDLWDLTVIGSYAICADEPGEPKYLDNPDPATWQRTSHSLAGVATEYDA